MNLQTIAVIFAIIVIPISLVLSAYIGTHIDTLVYQSQYDTKLAESTYDAVKAFQLNTLNNQYSTISDSKIRDIEASVNIFFDSLGTNLGWGSYNENQVKEYVPALVYTLYDGYYIYSKYDNIGDGNTNYTQENQYGLKPYIYYTCRYKNDSLVNPFDFVVNYTLDNAIVIYGYIGDLGYQTVSGYMVGNLVDTTTERLFEKILVLKDDGTVNVDESKKYEYRYNKDGTKIYTIIPGEFSNPDNLFLYKDSKKVSIGTIDYSTINSAEYYNNSYNNIKDIIEEIQTATNLEPYDNQGNKLENVAFSMSIFDRTKNPEDPSSDFNEHKRAVIQRSIKSNLYTAMANFSRNSTSSYEFRMPEIDETEWDKVVGNVGVIAFMQGIPMGNKYYNDYCIVSNNNNKEFVSEDSIYIVDTKENIYHRVGCSMLNGHGKDDDDNDYEAYLNIDFRRQTVKGKIDENGDGNYEDKNYYYYPQQAQACYSCIISQNNIIEIETLKTDTSKTELLKLFYRALAREKYNLYKVNDYLNDT